MTSADLQSERTKLRRKPERGAHDFETVAAILDEGLFCHIGFVADGQPYVVPTTYGRDGRSLYIHGSAASRMLRALGAGVPLCLTVTLLDGLVLARSAFHNSMNYRSAMVLGVATAVDGDERERGLRTIVEHVMPGRWADTRTPSAKELKQTTVLRLPIDEASAKVRSGAPVDEPEDVALPYWGGELPLRLLAGEPVADEHVADGVAVPEYIAAFRRPGT